MYFVKFFYATRYVPWIVLFFTNFCFFLLTVCMFVCPALQAGSVDDLRSFKSRRQPTRRSARSGTIRGPIDPKGSVFFFFERENCIQHFFVR